MQLLTARPHSRGRVGLRSTDPFDLPLVCVCVCSCVCVSCVCAHVCTQAHRKQENAGTPPAGNPLIHPTPSQPALLHPPPPTCNRLTWVTLVMRGVMTWQPWYLVYGLHATWQQRPRLAVTCPRRVGLGAALRAMLILRHTCAARRAVATHLSAAAAWVLTRVTARL